MFFVLQLKKIALLYIGCILTWVQPSFSQTKLDFTFTTDTITVQKDASSSRVPKLYRGQITRDELTSATAIYGIINSTEKYYTITPLVPLDVNTRYTLFYEDNLDYFEISTESTPGSLLRVESIYPSASELPENLLKWYIKFSKPINDTQVYNHIHVVNAAGDTLKRTILPLENVLIDSSGTLLTLWVEPGRQKRGLGPNTALGGVFNAGEQYSLIVANTLKDRNGIPINAEYRKVFKTIEADRIKPSLKNWNIRIPKAHSKQVLQILLTEQLDFGSTLDRFTLFDTDGNQLQGVWSLTNSETQLNFVPAQKWLKGGYKIMADPRIEDLAGNNLDRLFDNPITPELKQKEAPSYHLEFQVE